MSSHKQKPRRLSTATAVLSALLAMTCVNKPAVSAGPPFDWGNWDGILRTRLKPAVRFGVPLTGLDYRGLRRSRGSFDKVVAALARYQPTGIRARREKLSFWISAYNVGTVKVVLDNPKLTGIRQVGSIFRSVWKTKVIVIGGKSMSLDQIEHGILRKMGEPRIHFAVVCASASFPDLRAEAFLPARLEAQLNDQARRFLLNSRKGLRMDPKQKILYLSKIFSWFRGDFGDSSGLIRFLGRYLPQGAAPGRRRYRIKHFDYNWKLNSQ